MEYKKTFLYILLGLLINLNLLAQNKNIAIKTKRNSDNSVDFYYTKKKAGSYYLELRFEDLQNANGLTKKTVIKDKTGLLFSIQPINKKKPIQYSSYKFRARRGNPNTKIDTTFKYILPFKINKEITVTERKEYIQEKYFNKKKPHNWYSYAVKTKTKDTICSMRKGLVVFVRNKYENQSLEVVESTTKVNMIVIEHSDTSLAYYFGFDKDKIFVKEGETVYPQTNIGVLSKSYETEYLLNFYMNYLAKDSNSTKILVKYFKPYFYSSKEDFQIEEDKNYLVEFNEDLFFKEFSKREKKKYLKKN